MKDIQKRVREFCEKNNLELSPEHRLLDVFSELGEVAKEILKMTDYGRKPMEFREEIKSELGDALYSLITVANSFDIDLEQALEMVLKKYEKRIEKGGIGSEYE